MQVRRLITVLNKMIKDNPSVAYAPVAVYPKAFNSDEFIVRGFNQWDIGTCMLEWDTGKECENRKERLVLVIGGDRLMCDLENSN
jgi:hypothetical protein